MIAAMIMGAVAGHGMGLGDVGTLSYAMGAGVYGPLVAAPVNSVPGM